MTTNFRKKWLSHNLEEESLPEEDCQAIVVCTKPEIVKVLRKTTKIVDTHPESLVEKVRKEKPALILSVPPKFNKENPDLDHALKLESLSNDGHIILHFDEQFDGRSWPLFSEFPVYHCKGNLTIVCNSEEIAKRCVSWAVQENRDWAPRSIKD